MNNKIWTEIHVMAVISQREFLFLMVTKHVQTLALLYGNAESWKHDS